MGRIFVIVVLLAAFSSVFSQDNFPDVPEGHTAYKRIMQLRRLGLLDAGPNRFDNGPSRKELTKVIADGIEHLHSILEPALAEANGPLGMPKAVIWRNMTTFHDVRSKNLFGLCLQDFRPDLVKLGRDPDKLAAILAADQKLVDWIIAAWEKQYRAAGGTLFRDVPLTHWAWKDVQDLKDAGILVGYPDSGFGG